MSSHIKKAFVIRLGAIGDILISSPVLRALKNDGYHVTLLCKKHAPWLLRNTGLVDEYVFWTKEHDAEAMKRAKGDETMMFTEADGLALEMGRARGVDVNLSLSGVIEGPCLRKVYEFSPEFVHTHPMGKIRYNTVGHGNKDWKPPEKNHAQVMLEYAGYPDADKRPAWTVSRDEVKWQRKKFKKWNISDKHFVIIYQLSGSGIAKTWPYAKEFCELVRRYMPRARIITLGIGMDELLEIGWAEYMPWVVPFATNRCPAEKGEILTDEETGEEYQDYQYVRRPMTFRQDGALVNAADLYVGPDTSFLHVAGALGVPNVPLYTITDHTMIGKYYAHTYPVHSPVSCHPCGKLVTDCDKGPTGAALCMEGIRPESVLKQTMEVYKKWQDQAGRERIPA